MYENQTEELIKQRMLDRVSSDVDKSEGSFTNDAIAPVAVEFAQSYIEMDRFLTMVFAQTAAGEYLDKRGAEFGITRKAGVRAIGIVRFTGNNGVSILSGTQVQTESGLTFTTKQTTVIDNGIANVEVEADEVGAIYNVPSNTLNQLPVRIPGVEAITNTNPTTGGSDVESDSVLLTRLLIKVQAPSTSGNINDYRVWSLSVSGVGDAKVFPTWNGNGTVKVVIADTDKQPANNSIVTNVADYIESVRPIGVTVTVASAQALNINVSVTVIKDAAFTLQQVKDNITVKITDYLKNIAFKSNYVSYAKIGNAIIDSSGVLDYSSLTVNGGTANVSIGAEQVAVLGTVTVNE